MKHKYTVHFEGDETEFRKAVKWQGDNYKIEKIVLGKSYYWIVKRKIFTWISSAAYWVARKADKFKN